MHCINCNDPTLIPLRTQSIRVCPSCGTEHPWALKPDQKPVIEGGRMAPPPGVTDAPPPGVTPNVVRYLPLTPTATLPTRGTAGAAGYDLYLDADSVTVTPGVPTLLSTGIKCEIRDGFFGQIRDRSSVALKKSCLVMAGVIDSDYENEVKVLLVNVSNTPMTFQRGDRIAQIIIIKYETNDNDVSLVKRTGGFGSTGIGTDTPKSLISQ